jgi:hypothetical protein
MQRKNHDCYCDISLSSAELLTRDLVCTFSNHMQPSSLHLLPCRLLLDLHRALALIDIADSYLQPWKPYTAVGIYWLYGIYTT